MLKRREVLPLATVLLGVAVIAAPAAAQDPGQGDSYRLAIGGYDPVAYFTDGRPVLGKPEFQYPWDEARYRFASAQHMTSFRADPDRFVPQFAGSCAMGMSRGMKIEANPENWLISNGRLFVFYNSDAKAHFQADAQRTTADADKNWELVKNAPFGTSPTR